MTTAAPQEGPRERGVRMAFVRANLHDSTPAIERAMEASHDFVREAMVLCWNRNGLDLPASEEKAGRRIERFARNAPPRSLKIMLRTLQYQWWVLRKLWTFRPDAVQSLDFESSWPSALYCVLRRRRLIYDMRDPVALCYQFPGWMRVIIQAAESLVLGLSKGYVIPSEWLRSCLGRWGRTASTRPVAVVRNTCHDWSGADEPAQANGGPARIAFVGYLVESRGAAELLDVCEALPGQAELVVAGTCRSESLIERLKSNPAVTMKGSLPREQAFRVMRDAHLVALLYDPALPVNVLASPNKFFEAMMLGTPVIVSEGIHLAELVREQKLGYVVPYGDAGALRAAVEDIRRPGVRDAFRARCRAHYLAEFQLADDVGRYREFYGQVLRSA